MPRDSADGSFVNHVPDPGTLDLGDALTLSAIQQLYGSCAILVQRSMGGSFQLADGRVFVPTSKLGEHIFQPAPGPFAAHFNDQRTPAEKQLPRVGGSSLLSSVKVDFQTGGGDFVGVWRVGNKWLVRSFSLREDRSFTKPRPLLTSRLPVRGLTYLASPDSPSGRLELVQQQRDGRARSIVFDWWHNFAFRPR